MEYEKVTNLLGNILPNQLPRYVTKNGSRFMMNQMKHITQTRALDLKHHN